MQRHAATLALLVLALAAFHSSSGQPDPSSPLGTAATLKTADSLFAARRYTQAFERYAALRAEGRWSPAMLLKMAYIQEGLGHLGESLYYLNLYSLASHDDQATVKMAELAEKNRLEGYADDALEAFRTPLREYYVPIAGLLSALGLLFLALKVNRFRQNKAPSLGFTLVLVLLLAGLYAHVQYSPQSNRAIVTRANTYLMAAPSAGASVVEIIGEGHCVRIKGRSDAWLQVQWKDRQAYVRDFLVKRIQL